MDHSYEAIAYSELKMWQRKMLRKPMLFNRLSKGIQRKINSWIPEKEHKAITVSIKQMIRAILFGAKYTVSKPLENVSLLIRENMVKKKIETYKNAPVGFTVNYRLIKKLGITAMNAYRMRLLDTIY